MYPSPFQTGDHRLCCLHPPGQLGLCQPGFGAGFDNGMGEFEFLRQLFILLFVFGILQPFLMQGFCWSHFQFLIDHVIEGFNRPFHH